ncbi:MAG: hypothetical protein HYX92_20910 [Chloroflexi bacterium]|nr:hypothetical protein [Chloroflexota bacterium]
MKTAALGAEYLLNPVGEVDVLDIGLAPRVEELNGKIVAIIDNGKEYANVFLARLEKKLTEKYKFAEIIHDRKRRSSGPAPRLKEIGQRADVVILGLGI